MENSVYCPICNECTIYINDITHNEIIGLSYRNLYCLQVNKKFKMCKRYHAYIKLGKSVPSNILPNSRIKLEEMADILN